MIAREHRVTKGDDYRLTARVGVRGTERGLAVSVRRRDGAEAPTRFGFIIPKRVGVAVVRNRVRRRLKAVSAESLPDLPGGLDIVYRVHPEAAEAGFDTLRQRARNCLGRALRRLAERESAS